MIDVADDGHHFGAVQIYDTKRRRWSVLDQEMPIQGGQCFFDGERILVLGGVTSEERPPPRNIPVKVNFKAEVRKAHKRASSLSFLGEKSEVLLPTAGTPALEDLSSEEEDEEDRGKEEEGEEEDSEGRTRRPPGNVEARLAVQLTGDQRDLGAARRDRPLGGAPARAQEAPRLVPVPRRRARGVTGARCGNWTLRFHSLQSSGMYRLYTWLSP